MIRESHEIKVLGSNCVSEMMCRVLNEVLKRVVGLLILFFRIYRYARFCCGGNESGFSFSWDYFFLVVILGFRGFVWV